MIEIEKSACVSKVITMEHASPKCTAMSRGRRGNGKQIHQTSCDACLCSVRALIQMAIGQWNGSQAHSFSAVLPPYSQVELYGG